MSRLRRNKGLTKTAAYYMSLHSIILKSGDYIDFQVKILANKPWYTIIQDSEFSASSYYDGPDFDKAFEFYIEIVLAFKGVAIAEQVKKLRSDFERKANRLIDEKNANRFDDMYQSLKRNPLFLGVNDF